MTRSHTPSASLLIWSQMKSVGLSVGSARGRKHKMHAALGPYMVPGFDMVWRQFEIHIYIFGNCSMMQLAINCLTPVCLSISSPGTLLAFGWVHLHPKFKKAVSDLLARSQLEIYKDNPNKDVSGSVHGLFDFKFYFVNIVSIKGWRLEKKTVATKCPDHCVI